PFWHGFLLLFGFGAMAIIAISYLTPAERPETLHTFYKLCRPPGLWGPVTELMAPEERSAIRAETARDMFDCALGVCFAGSAILSVVAAMGRQWGTLGAAFAV